MNVEKEIIFEPRENEKDPSDAHCQKHKRKHYKAKKGEFLFNLLEQLFNDKITYLLFSLL